MFSFLIRASTTDQPIEPVLPFHRRDLVERQLLFDPEETLSWSNRAGTVSFKGWQAFTDHHGVRSHWAIDDVGLTSVAGHAWPHETGPDPDRSWAEMAALHLMKHDLMDSVETLFGNFAVLTMPNEGTGMLFTDLLSVSPVFWAEADGTLFVSNRAGMVAAALPRSDGMEKSPDGVGWLMFWGTILSNETGYRHVNRLPVDSFIELGTPQGARLRRKSSKFWEEPGNGVGRSTYESVLPFLERDLIDSIRGLATLPGPKPVVHLSGGKDSRLLAAVVAHCDLQDRFRFITYGVPGFADVEAGRMVAEAAGLDWSFEDRTGADGLPGSVTVPIHTAHVEGLTNAWDRTSESVASDETVVTGNLGEFMRPGPLSNQFLGLADRSSANVIESMRTRKSFDPSRLLNAETNERYRDQMASWAEARIAEGAVPEKLGIYFLPDTRPRSWLGPNRSAKASLWALPFITPRVTRSLLDLPSASLSGARFHFDLIARFQPNLLAIPLAGNPWIPKDCQHHPLGQTALEAGEVISTVESRNWRSNQFAQDRAFFLDVFADRSNLIFSIVDRARLERLLALPEATGGNARMLYSALTAAVWLGDLEDLRRIRRSGRQSRELIQARNGHGRIAVRTVPPDLVSRLVPKRR